MFPMVISTGDTIIYRKNEVNITILYAYIRRPELHVSEGHALALDYTDGIPPVKQDVISRVIW